VKKAVSKFAEQLLEHPIYNFVRQGGGIVHLGIAREKAGRIENGISVASRDAVGRFSAPSIYASFTWRRHEKSSSASTLWTPAFDLRWSRYKGPLSTFRIKVSNSVISLHVKRVQPFAITLHSILPSVFYEIYLRIFQIFFKHFYNNYYICPFPFWFLYIFSSLFARDFI